MDKDQRDWNADSKTNCEGGEWIMTIRDVAEKSSSRSARWHPTGIGNWSALEWAGAMAGEAGEACNAAKKMKRMESDMATINDPSRSYAYTAAAGLAVAKEAADTILYAVLLIERVGCDAETVIRNVFNQKSEEYGFPERL